MEILQDINVGNAFLKKTPEAQAIMVKSNNDVKSSSKAFCAAKKTLSKGEETTDGMGDNIYKL